MVPMTKRERIMRTARFQETDRVPLYDILQNDAIIEHYAGRELRYEDGAYTCGLAVGRALDMTRMVTAPQPPGEVVRGDGIRFRQERWTSWIVERPFHNLETLGPWIEERIRDANLQTYGHDYAASVRKQIETHWAAFAEGRITFRKGRPVCFNLFTD